MGEKIDEIGVERKLRLRETIWERPLIQMRVNLNSQERLRVD